MSTRIPIVEMAIGQCPLSDINSSFDPLCHFCEVSAGAVCHLATHFESPPSWFGLVCPCYLPPAHHHAAASQSQHQVESGTSSSCGKQTKVSDVTCGDVRGRWSAGLVAKLRKDGKESKYNKGWAGAWWGSLGCLLPPGSTCLAPAVPLRTVADSLSPKASICVSLQSILVAVHQKSFSLSCIGSSWSICK